MERGTAEHKKLGSLIVFEIAKTNNERKWRCEHARFCVEVFYALYINFHSFIHEMMSSILSNILGWPGGNSSKQLHLIHMRASRHDSAVTLAQPTQARCGLSDTFDQSQTSIEHNYPCNFMNMKENILFLGNE